MNCLVSLLTCAISFLLLKWCTGQTPETPPPAIRYQLILGDLSAVTNARTTLESKLGAYQEEYILLIAQKKEQTASCVCFNNIAVAFTAHVNTDVSILGIDQPLPFDRVALNEGGAYDARHAQFRAPFNGTYKFFVTLTANAAQPIVVDFMLNGSPVIKSRTGNNNYITTSMNAVVVHMNAGDDVWVQHDHSITDSNRVLHGDGYLTTFSGYLVGKD